LEVDAGAALEGGPVHLIFPHHLQLQRARHCSALCGIVVWRERERVCVWVHAMLRHGIQCKGGQSVSRSVKERDGPHPALTHSLNHSTTPQANRLRRGKPSRDEPSEMEEQRIRPVPPPCSLLLCCCFRPRPRLPPPPPFSCCCCCCCCWWCCCCSSPGADDAKGLSTTRYIPVCEWSVHPRRHG
jgi:hypothetical protein